jgi:hypothetical protein
MRDRISVLVNWHHAFLEFEMNFFVRVQTQCSVEENWELTEKLCELLLLLYCQMFLLPSNLCRVHFFVLG